MSTLEFPRIKRKIRDKNTLEDVAYHAKSRERISRILYLQRTYDSPLTPQVIKSVNDESTGTKRETVEIYSQTMGVYWFEAYSVKDKWSGWDKGMALIFLGGFLAAGLFTRTVGALPAHLFGDYAYQGTAMLGILGLMLAAAMLFCSLGLKKSRAVDKRGRRLGHRDSWVHLPVGNPTYLRTEVHISVPTKPYSMVEPVADARSVAA